MAKNPHAIALGKLGGRAKSVKYDKGQITELGRGNRKPDDQISEHALYMRDYRMGFRKSKLPKQS